MNCIYFWPDLPMALKELFRVLKPKVPASPCCMRGYTRVACVAIHVLHVWLYTYFHTYIHTYIQTYIQMYIPPYIRVQRYNPIRMSVVLLHMVPHMDECGIGERLNMVYICTHIYTCWRMWSAYMYVYIHIHTHICIHTYVRTQHWVNRCICVCFSMCDCTCMCMCMCVRVFVLV